MSLHEENMDVDKPAIETHILEAAHPPDTFHDGESLSSNSIAVHTQYNLGSNTGQGLPTANIENQQCAEPSASGHLDVALDSPERLPSSFRQDSVRMLNCVREKETALADLASSICNYVLHIERIHKNNRTFPGQAVGLVPDSATKSSNDMIKKMFDIIEGPLKTSGFDVAELRAQIAGQQAMLVGDTTAYQEIQIPVICKLHPRKLEAKWPVPAYMVDTKEYRELTKAKVSEFPQAFKAKPFSEIDQLPRTPPRKRPSFQSSSMEILKNATRTPTKVKTPCPQASERSHQPQVQTGGQGLHLPSSPGVATDVAKTLIDSGGSLSIQSVSGAARQTTRHTGTGDTPTTTENPQASTYQKPLPLTAMFRVCAADGDSFLEELSPQTDMFRVWAADGDNFLEESSPQTDMFQVCAADGDNFLEESSPQTDMFRVCAADGDNFFEESSP
jgi:hypothetical protein